MPAIPYEFFDAHLTPTDFRVACALMHLGDDFGELTASLEDLAPYTKVSHETMRRSFRRLEEKGILCTTRLRNAQGTYDLNRYQLLVGQVA